jgi:hypothetical protein
MIVSPKILLNELGISIERGDSLGFEGRGDKAVLCKDYAAQFTINLHR